MADGFLTFVLHAHLPFVRHPEHDDFLEEDWLFEAITETYVPLASAFLRLRDDGVPFRLGMSVTAPLAAMLGDALLRARYRRHLERLCELAERETRGHGEGTRLGGIARHYLHRFGEVRSFIDRHKGDLLAPLRDLEASGHLELLGCTATHGFLPHMSAPSARRAQIRAGLDAHAAVFGRRPRGLWLAECGYDHGIDRLLAEEGVEHFVLETHGLTFGRPAPAAGPHAPVRTPAGPAALGRDPESSRQVWSADEGYPGDPDYREFYRDLGFDAGYDYIRPYLHADGVRRGVGLKYHRVTGRVPLHAKDLYEPWVAEARARAHARNFVFNRRHQAQHLRGALGRRPLLIAPYDAELFGHWWYEGPIFLEHVFRALADEPAVDPVTPSEAIALAEREGPLPIVRPNPSTWGAGGSNKVWLNGGNAWLYRRQHWAEEEMTGLARRFGRAEGLEARALRQAGRELLLLQSSDWAFILTTGTTPPYAVRRAQEHFESFRTLHGALHAGRVEPTTLRAMEERTPIFPSLDAAAWA